MLTLEAINLCRTSYVHFIAAIQPDFVFSDFSRQVANDLQRFYIATQRGEMPNLLLEAPPQHGKQIADHIQVLTTKGWKNHGNLKIGDYVFKPNGNPVKVTAVTKKTPSKMRVVLTNGEEIWCHENHEWTVTSHDWKGFRTFETKQLYEMELWNGEKGKRGSRAKYQLPLSEAIIGERKNLPVDPYVLGAWLGDGSQTKPCITHDHKDSAVVEMIESRGYKKTTVCVHNKTGVHTTYFESSLKADLRKAGVFTKKTGVRKKQIPDEYLTADIDSRLDLLSGLIDTDGYMYPRNGRTVFTTSDINLADSFCSLISTFGWSYSFVTEQPKLSSSGIQGKSEYYVIGFNPNLEIPCTLERKKNGKLLKKRRKVAISEITFHEDSTYQGHCITVDSEDGLYLVGKTLQPTHNSREAAELFPAWVLGINPNIRISVATYAFPLAKKRNMEIQRVINSPIYRQIFPETKLRTSNDPTEGEKSSEGFDIIKRKGGARFVGVGGSLTGFPTDIGIIDDPYKDMAQARSSTQNAAVIEWYNSVFKTRMSKVSGTVLMLTRWTTNDLAAWCATNEDWTEVKYRAIENGEALVPHLHPLEQLKKIKSSMPAVIWEAMYQQNPFIQGGNVIREEWLQYYQILPERFDKIFITGDTAQKAKEHNDFTVFSVWGVTQTSLYWLDMWRDKVTSPGLRKAAKDIWDKWHPGYGETRASGFYIEDKASGTGLIQDLQLESAIPIVPVQRDKDKYTRLLDVLNYIQAGRLQLPANAPWTNVAIGEMAAFSADMKHEHDDIVDTLIDGLEISFGPGNVSMFDVL